MNGNVLFKIQNLQKKFGDLTVFDGLNETICKGDVVVIIGPSGGGKSTFIRCLNLLEQPTAGKIYFEGEDITAKGFDVNKHRQKVGMVFQQFNLFNNLTVLENITISLTKVKKQSEEESKAKALKLLKRVGLEDKANAYPSQLSGGQKQRVAIARALANEPRYLLCDEATSALDPNTTQQILELLQRINAQLGVTIIVITHEMRVIDRICTRVAVIDQSCIAECGKVSDVFVNPKSPIAQELILQKDRRAPQKFSGKRIRLVFDGTTTTRPVISDLVLACQAPVSIIFADTRDVGGVTYGHMIVELPEDRRQQEKIKSWLEANQIHFKEEEPA